MEKAEFWVVFVCLLSCFLTFFMDVLFCFVLNTGFHALQAGLELAVLKKKKNDLTHS